jgi:hypothetical protein
MHIIWNISLKYVLFGHACFEVFFFPEISALNCVIFLIDAEARVVHVPLDPLKVA